MKFILELNKSEIVKILHFKIKIAPWEIDSLNFGNFYLNYTYSIICLIKNLK
jgi:hypothetical protein